MNWQTGKAGMQLQSVSLFRYSRYLTSSQVYGVCLCLCTCVYVHVCVFNISSEPCHAGLRGIVEQIRGMVSLVFFRLLIKIQKQQNSPVEFC